MQIKTPPWRGPRAEFFPSRSYFYLKSFLYLLFHSQAFVKYFCICIFKVCACSFANYFCIFISKLAAPHLQNIFAFAISKSVPSHFQFIFAFTFLRSLALNLQNIKAIFPLTLPWQKFPSLYSRPSRPGRQLKLYGPGQRSQPWLALILGLLCQLHHRSRRPSS